MSGLTLTKQTAASSALETLFVPGLWRDWLTTMNVQMWVSVQNLPNEVSLCS